MEHVFQSGQISHSHYVSPNGPSGTPPPIYFLNNPLEEVLSFKLLGLPICHDLSWESHISILASKSSHQMLILGHAKSFLGPPQHLTTDIALGCSLMEYCSPLWAGAPALHLSRLCAVETKAFRIIGISHDEAESLSSHSLTAGRSVIFQFSTISSLVSPPCSVCDMSPPFFRRALKVRQQPPSGKTSKITNHCSPLLFHSSFSPPLE